MDKASVSVKIMNDTYALRTSAPAEKVKQIAEEVDKRMQSLAADKNIQYKEKLAIWTALDLAADLLELQDRYDRLLAAVRER